MLVLACFSFLFLFSRDSGNHSFVLHHDRRDSPRARQQPTTTSISGSGSTPTSSASNSTVGAVGPMGLPALQDPPPPPSASPTTSSFSSSVSSAQSVSSRPSTSLPSSSTTLSSTRTTSSTRTPPTLTITANTGLSTPSDTPATTLLVSNNFLPTLAQASSGSSPSQTDTSTSVGIASSHASFWQKKGAVAATFVIISLVVAAVGAVAIMSYLKRRSNRYQERLHDELFEKYTPQVHRSHSPGLSINDPPIDVFASRDIGYNDSPPHQLYRISETQSDLLHSSTSVQNSGDYNTQSTPARYLAPSESLFSKPKSAAPPSSFHQHTNRNSYQPSIDSFYGAGTSGRI